MELVLLDTDMLSEVLKQRHAQVVAKATTYLRSHGSFAFSAFTRFEISRGFKEKRATSQLTRFREFCQHSTIIPVTDSVFDRAEDLWAIARRGGRSCGDADLIIAATALDTGRIGMITELHRRNRSGAMSRHDLTTFTFENTPAIVPNLTNREAQDVTIIVR